ncbi:MAG: UDP-N-acetylmuramoyl-L-alanine--D-glutamate ligase [Chloroflexota bacterium]|nr:UDP-N-acetylmuramoyl-L-alanine--D-glutamate ligase [Chloroflexota bacterium]
MSNANLFKGKRVTVVGLGIEGVDLVRFLHAQGARITVSDARPAERLQARLEQIAAIPVHLSLGANDPRDMVTTDIIFVSQGVPLDLPALAEARKRGVPLSSMFKLFLELCPGPVAGITGSSGKTTTTALVGEMFHRDGLPHFVGGNIGVGLLSHLGRLTSDTWVILEISHTQLQLLPERSPNVACVLNITPNHLDRFSWDDYRRLKGDILRHQKADDCAVLGYDDAEARALAQRAAGEALYFSLASDLPGDGSFLRDGWAVWRRRGREQKLFPFESLRLPGRHNWSNALAAAAVARACGVSPRAIAQAAAEFQGLPHRLEFVASLAGVDYYNDSIATTPERTLAALRSFSQPPLLLLGGRDKHLPLEELADEACRRCRGVVFFGESGPLLEEAVQRAAQDRPAADRPRLVRVASLAEAVEASQALAQPGDVVLLSPACTSYDAYDNFEERGADFRRLLLAQACPEHSEGR